MGAATEWFEAAVQPNIVSSELTRVVPELVRGRKRLLGCRVTRLRVAPEDGHWTATYLLDVLDDDTGERQAVNARGTLTPPGVSLPGAAGESPLGADGWQCVLPRLRLHLTSMPVDAALPGLTAVTNPARARVLLEHVVRTCHPELPELGIAGCIPSVLSSKPGVRATVMCELDYTGVAEASARPPAALVVKCHHDDEGRRAHDVLEALWASPIATSESLGLARPFAYLPDLRMSVQTYVEHDVTFKDLFRRAFDGGHRDTFTALVAASRATGSGLAELHGSGVVHGPAVTWADEEAALRRKHDKLQAVVPWLDDQTGALLDRLSSAAASTPPDPPAPTHHSFRPAQVLLTGDRVSFIDLDKLCQAEPASDIAAFTTKLWHMAVNKTDATSGFAAEADGGAADGARDQDRERLDDVGRLRSALLSGYRARATVSPDRVRHWEGLELFALMLSAAKKMDRDRAVRCRQALEDHLGMGDSGTVSARPRHLFG